MNCKVKSCDYYNTIKCEDCVVKDFSKLDTDRLIELFHELNYQIGDGELSDAIKEGLFNAMNEILTDRQED